VVVVLFGGLEGILALAGMKTVRSTEDPFVGFASSIPLYVEKPGTGGPAMMVTAQNKLAYFNPQEFPKSKPAGTYRIFCMGESTTFGNPYTDILSFPGWLRELLPLADPARTWEVINAGGISYASYRIALLMEELSKYEPDLFIVYCGHNEFLEERTYRSVRDTPGWMLSLQSLLSYTRTYSLVRSMVHPPTVKAGQSDKREVLDAEVSTILDRSVGPSAYTRDDELRRYVLEHYRIGMDRMVDIARSAGARILFVTPASNLKDCSPFKSEHRSGLSESERTRADALLAQAQARYAQGALAEALEAAQGAVSNDDRFAQALYLEGRILFDLGRYPEAKARFVRARDEDVCPLRGLSPIIDTVRQIAASRGVGLVDYVAMVEHASPHGIAGRELFMDHVHPTIAGNGMIARALVESLAERGVVKPGPGWNETAIEAVGRKMEARVTPEMRVFALNHLSLLLGWSGKFEESNRLLADALKQAPDNPELLHRAGLAAHRAGRREEAVQYFTRALAVNPKYPESNFRLGVALFELGQVDAGVSRLVEAVRLNPENAEVHFNLGVALGLQKKHDEALDRYRTAVRLNPRYPEAHHNIAVIAAQQGRIGEAIEHCSRAIEIRESFLPSRWLLGRLLAGQRRIPEAVAQYEEGVRRAPEMARDAYLQLGQLLAQAGETPGALRYLRLAEQADPGNAGLGCQLAEAYRLCQSAADVARAEASCRAGARPVAPAR
jgi:tetratricopeptide (TPR) repeat protein